MIAADIAAVVETLDLALRDGRPEDVLGVEDPSREWRRLARSLHPDANGGSVEAAAAFRKLDELWRLAVVFRDAGTYGSERAPVVRVATKTRTYEFLDRVGSDDVADRFRARWGMSAGYARVARKPRDNDLMRAEARALRQIVRDGRFDPEYLRYLPSLVESVGVRQSGGVVRQANVFAVSGGDWHSLADVLGRYRFGVDPRDMAWMWRRLLDVLGAVHQTDVIHGALTPENVLIEPDMHGLMLTNWSCSIVRGGRVPAASRKYRTWYAPEVLAKDAAGRGSDIYLAARTMLGVCGSTDHVATFPAAWPRTLRAFFRGCLIEDPRRRPRDAWALLEDFDEVLERTYGPRRFRPFTMKGGTL